MKTNKFITDNINADKKSAFDINNKKKMPCVIIFLAVILMLTYNLNIEAQEYPPNRKENINRSLEVSDIFDLKKKPPVEELLNSFESKKAENALSPNETTNLLVNGSFETGSFSGWTITETSNVLIPWQVTTARTGTFGMPMISPQDGQRLALNGFDGGTPLPAIQTLHQDVTIPSSTQAILTWKHRISWRMNREFTSVLGTQPRIFQVQIRNSSSNAILSTIYTLTASPGTSRDGNWETHTFNLSSFAGQRIRIYFIETIPENYTGPAQFELDDVRLNSTMVTHAMTGTIRTPGGAPLGGVTLTLTGTFNNSSFTASATTIPDGSYIFRNIPSGGTYTVRPSLANHNFTPESRSYPNLNGDRTSEDYTGMPNVVCNYTISPTSAPATANGGTSGFNIFTANGCQWNAVSNAPWLRTNSAGTGNGAITYTVDPNTGAAAREGTITVANRTFTVTQSGAQNATFSISGRVTNGGAPLSGITVVASAGAVRTTVTDADGNYTLTNLPPDLYSVRPVLDGAQFNPSGLFVRVLNASVPNQNFSLVVCTYRLATISKDIPVQGTLTAQGSVSLEQFEVLTGDGCQWKAVSNASWIVVENEGDGVGRGFAKYFVHRNYGAARAGTITVNGQLFVVRQAAALQQASANDANQDSSTQCGNFTITGETDNLPRTVVPFNSGRKSFIVDTAEGCQWTAFADVESPKWITVENGVGASGRRTVSFTLEENKSNFPRAGKITISTVAFTVVQTGNTIPACDFILDPNNPRNFAAGGGNGIFRFSVPSGCLWVAFGDDIKTATPWTRFSSPESTAGSGSGAVDFTVNSNNGNSPRVGTLVVGNKGLNITQAGDRCVYEISPRTQEAAAGGQDNKFQVRTPPGCRWRAERSDADSFITIRGVGGDGDGVVDYDTASNPNAAARSGTIRIIPDNPADQGGAVTITQDGAQQTCNFIIEPPFRNVPGTGGIGDIQVTASSSACLTQVSVDNSIPWIKVDLASDRRSANFTVETNNTANQREGTFKIAGKTFTVTQAGGNVTQTPELSISGNSVAEGNSGNTPLNFTVRLSAAAAQDVTVNYSTANGTATAGQDYIAVSNQTITIPAGQTTGTATVQVIGDTIDEENETFTVTLSNAQGATIAGGQGSATGTIIDDDTAGTIQFAASGYTVGEGDGTAVITVTRTGGAASGVTVNYATSNGTAIAGQDYTATSGTLNFGAGESSKTFSVPIINDSTNEPAETVNLTLSSPTGGATLGAPATAVLTINDNDGANITVTVRTNPDGLSFTIGNETFTAARTISVAPGTQLTIGTTAQQNGSAGMRFVWQNWSDGGALSHTVAPTTDMVFTANFKTQHQLTTSVNPTNGGTISRNPTSADGWYDAGQNIQLTAAPNSGFTFNNWTGSINSSNNPLTVTMDSPKNQTANFTSAPVINNRPKFDFDGDRRADISVFRPSEGVWYLLASQAGFSAVGFGLANDRIVPADYDGDRRTDIAVWRENPLDAQRAEYFILQSSDSTMRRVQFGSSGDRPLAGDFDGDGRDDLAVYREGASAGAPSSFFYHPSSQPATPFVGVQWGSNGDKAVPADYDGDGKADAAVYRPSNGVWYVLKTTTGQLEATQFGVLEDKPVVGDYDGDGRADLAVFRPSSGVWFLLRSRDGFGAAQFGISEDNPAAADYDGDGKTDIAVYRPSNGVWYVLSSQTGGFFGVGFGTGNDRPVENSFVP